jgi:hypothetical protein
MIMKKNIRMLGVMFALVTATVISPKQASAQQDYVSLQVFYDELSPYGEWVESAQYGYVWIPDAGSDFMPYSTEGQWIMTDYGWTWVSDYPWGWATFHYGRWDHDNYYGWIWVPDYGWQPMRPGISINLSFGNDYYNNYNDYWMFVSDRDFQRPNVSRYYVTQTNRDRIIRNSTVINNTYIDNSRNTTYVSGPARDDVQRTTGKRVNSVVIRENNRPGQDLKNGQLQIYRPNVRKNNDTGRKPAPTRITSKEDVKRPSERNATNQQRNASPTNSRQQQQQQQQQRKNTINQQNIDRGNSQRDQQQKVNQSENTRRQQQQQQQQQQEQQRQNNINQQNIDKGNAQREQQQKVNQSENNRRQQQQEQQRQNTINQQNIDKGNAEREQQQKVNQSENNRQKQQQQQQNVDKNNAQPVQQQKVDAPQNNVKEQRQINRQEKSNRNKQEKESKSQENRNR